MIEERLQDWLDRARIAADVRWALGAVAVLAVVAANVVIDSATPTGFGRGSIVISLLAVVAAVQAASHTAIAVVAIVVLHWTGSIEDVTDVRAPIVGVCLAVFHTTLALMAVTPHSAPVPAALVRRWAQRLGVVAVATFVTWLLVLALASRDAPGNAVLTVSALVLLLAGVLAVHARSTG